MIEPRVPRGISMRSKAQVKRAQAEHKNPPTKIIHERENLVLSKGQCTPATQVAKVLALALSLFCRSRFLVAGSILMLSCYTSFFAANAKCDSPELLFAQAEQLRHQWKVASLREAISKYEEAAECWRNAGSRNQEARALRAAGEARLTLGEYQEARTNFDAAVKLLLVAGDNAELAESLSDLTLSLTYLGLTDEAALAAREAVSAATTSGQALALAHALTSAGMLNYLRGNTAEALDNYVRALPIARQAGDVVGTAQILLNTGYVHGDVGELEEALSYYNQALPLWREANHRGGEASTFTSIGLAYTLLGDRQRALSILSEQALPLLVAMGDRVGEAASYNNIGYIYQMLGDYDPAFENYQRALDIYQQIGLVVGQSLTLQYVGGIHELSGRTFEALACYQQSLAGSRQVKNVLLEADALDRLGAISYSLGRATEAYDYFQKALKIYEQAGHLRGQSTTLNNIGLYFEALGQKQKALENYERSLPLCRLAGDQAAEATTLYNISHARIHTGDLSGARTAIEASIKISEALRSNISSHELRASYFASVHQQFGLYIDVLMALAARSGGQQAVMAAFEASERSRARSLLEALAETRANIRLGAEHSLLVRERALARQIEGKAALRVRLLAQKGSQQELATAERGLQSLITEYRQVQGEIRTSSPRYAALVQPEPLNSTEIQKRVLDEDTLLLEYFLGDENSFVWVVANDSLKYFRLPPRAVIEQSARRVYDLLTARNQNIQKESVAQRKDRLSRSESEYNEAAAALARIVLGPVAAELRSKRIVVVADGALQYLPFAALPDPARTDAAQQQALVVDHEVLSLPSASVLALMRQEVGDRQAAPKAVAVLADPVFDKDDQRLSVALSARSARNSRDGTVGALAGSRGQKPNSEIRKSMRSFDEGGARGFARLVFSGREARTIMALTTPGEGLLALGFSANRAMATGSEIPKYRIIHFATHGLLNGEHPELSGIVLSLLDETGRDQEGFLGLNEIYNLDLPAELVVLSACQSALGKDVRGEGLIGLTRGFMYAGAKRVVASLWKVDDAATAEIMKEFYKAVLVNGLEPSAALRVAQIHMWQQPRWRSPYFWAAFTLQGEWK